MELKEGEEIALTLLETTGITIGAILDYLMSPHSNYKKQEAGRLLQVMFEDISEAGKVKTNVTYTFDEMTVFDCIRQMHVEALHAYNALLEGERIDLTNFNQVVVTLVKLLDLSLEV